MRIAIHHLRSLAAALLLVCATPVMASDERGTAEEAQDMVARAIAYYDEVGANAAFARFNNDPVPEFVDRDLYVFVFGPDGKKLVHSIDSSLVGRTLESYIDVDGKRFGEEMRQTASPDGTWVDYKWKDPVTGEVVHKSSWMVLHDGHLFGVGIYVR